MSRTQPQTKRRIHASIKARMSRSGPFPINRLPDHVLANIFLIANHRNHSFGVPPFPYVVSFVCPLWRRVALSTPRLWDFISLSPRIERLSTHLMRSRNVPIDVSINLDDVDFGANDLEQNLELLMNHWSRIRNLQIILSEPDDAELVLDALNDKTKATSKCILEDVCVSLIGDIDNSQYGGYENVELDLLLPISQRLRRIELRGANLFPMRYRSTTTLLLLQELNIQGAPFMPLSDGLFRLLELMPNLTVLSLTDCNLGYDESTATRTILLSKIDSLSLYDVNGAKSLNVLLRKLDMPNLRSFTFATGLVFNLGAKMDWDAVSRYHKLEKLHLGGYLGGDIDQVLSCLDKLDKLRELQLFRSDEFHGHDMIIKKLARKLSSTSCCPRLEDLYIVFELDRKSLEALDGVKSARPLLKIDAMLGDDPDYDTDCYGSSGYGLAGGYGAKGYDSDDYISDYSG
jgi:hypothetical protein